MCDWTNLEEIMQDLSVAQRYMVPAPLETFGAVGPPATRTEEENKEQSNYASQGEGGDSPPDFQLIQNMLHMVNEKNSPVQSSDLEPLSPEIVKPKKIIRKLSLTPIKTAKETKLSARPPIPNDVVPLMFKKKSLNHSPHHIKEETCKNASPSKKTSTEQCKQYIPSTNASKYFEKYQQKSYIKEEFEEDIWASAERQMKELEKRKKLKAEIASPKENENKSLSTAAYAFDVNLPEHRHLMPGDCIVCIVAAKHGYYI